MKSLELKMAKSHFAKIDLSLMLNIIKLLQQF